MTVTGNPADPAQEVRGAKGVAITFMFDGPIREESVQVDESRIRILEVGESSLIIKPVTEPRADSPTEVSVLFAEGGRQRAAFVIVPNPSEVDTWIEVTRRPEQPSAACQAQMDELRARCGAQSPTAFRRSGLLAPEGIAARTFPRHVDSAGSFASDTGVSFLGKTWVLVDVMLYNLTGQPWAPRVATFKSKDGKPVTVRLVTPQFEEIAPGKSGYVLVETDVPPASAGVDFTLEVSGADGRSFLVPNVKLAPRTQEEGKR